MLQAQFDRERKVRGLPENPQVVLARAGVKSNGLGTTPSDGRKERRAHWGPPESPLTILGGWASVAPTKTEVPMSAPPAEYLPLFSGRAGSS